MYDNNIYTMSSLFLNQKLSISFYLKRLFKKNNLVGIVMHKGSPIDYVIKYLSSFKDIVCVNVDSDYMEVLDGQKKLELINLQKTNKNSYNNIIRPIIKSYVNGIRKVYNNQVRHIVLISSDDNILDYIGVKKNNISVLIGENGIKNVETPENSESREHSNRSIYKKFEYRTDFELTQLINFLLKKEQIIHL